jgi:hypothetical protein
MNNLTSVTQTDLFANNDPGKQWQFRMFDYTSLGRLKSVSNPEADLNTHTSYTYYRNGLLNTKRNSVGAVSYRLNGEFAGVEAPCRAVGCPSPKFPCVANSRRSFAINRLWHAAAVGNLTLVTGG